MRKLFSAFVSILIFANQATTVVPNTIADAAKTPVKEAGAYTIKLNTNKISVLELKSTQSSFVSVREHLIAEQNAKAAADKALKAEAVKKAAIKQIAPVAPKPAVIVASGDVWGQLRQCEAGSNYARNSGNGFYGAYQFDIGTWAGYGGYARADLAPPAVQDEKARQTQHLRGWYPWPGCAKKLGLI